MKQLARKFSIIFLGLWVLVTLLTGCGENAIVQDGESQVVTEESNYPRTLTDSYGKEITLESEPEHIISVAPNVTEMIYALNAQDKLVGRTKYCDYPEEVSTIDIIGTLRSPDIEKIISLQPDLVITSTHFDEENTAKLEEAGIVVMGLYEEYDVEGVYTMIDTLGKALNKETAATTLVNDMKKEIKAVEEKVSSLEKPSVYYVVGYGEGGDYSAPANTFVGQLLSIAGGNNIVPESDSWSYTLEALLEADPEIIIVRNGEKENFMTTEGYKELTAVKEGHVYEIDNNLLDRQGYRNATGIMELAKIMHPNSF